MRQSSRPESAEGGIEQESVESRPETDASTRDPSPSSANASPAVSFLLSSLSLFGLLGYEPPGRAAALKGAAMAFAFEKLIVYQKAGAFADAACTLTKGFPRGYLP